MERRHCSSVRENRIAIACRSSPARPPTQCSGAVGAGVAEDVRAGRHALAELVGKGGQRLLGHAERAQAVPGERQRDPAIRAVHRGARVRGRLHLVQQLGQPRPAARGGVERQELVAPGDRRRAGQQDVLDVVELEHRRGHCIWSSMSEKAAFSRSAFLISSAVTYGYSPYSRKLGTLVLADELDERLRVLLPILGEPFEIR